MPDHSGLTALLNGELIHAWNRQRLFATACPQWAGIRRLSGHTWDRAMKLVAEPTETDDDPAADEDDSDDYWEDED